MPIENYDAAEMAETVEQFLETEATGADDKLQLRNGERTVFIAGDEEYEIEVAEYGIGTDDHQEIVLLKQYGTVRNEIRPDSYLTWRTEWTPDA